MLEYVYVYLHATRWFIDTCPSSGCDTYYYVYNALLVAAVYIQDWPTLYTIYINRCVCNYRRINRLLSVTVLFNNTYIHIQCSVSYMTSCRVHLLI